MVKALGPFSAAAYALAALSATMVAAFHSSTTSSCRRRHYRGWKPIFKAVSGAIKLKETALAVPDCGEGAAFGVLRWQVAYQPLSAKIAYEFCLLRWLAFVHFENGAVGLALTSAVSEYFESSSMVLE